ncbi:MAG: hypothetical protein CMC05_03085 [Flavobacteriaceae bacterium]|nr:hypothetical protein [Flavobacteriaceae bacterium]|tara:strand:+ start:2185 stop:2610 length:426 start_codon:yes stop_codon:yes gene_type:complete
MKETKYYTCEYCFKEFQPKRRRVQKYCSNSCRSSAYQQRKAIENKAKDNLSKLTNSNVPQAPIKEKISAAGVGNAALGVLAVDTAKALLTSRENKPATKGDLLSLIEKLNARYHLVKNMPPNIHGEYPYYDMQQGILVYLK